MTVGYSGTPLSKKLGIKAGSTVWFQAAPEQYQDWLAPLPEQVEFVTHLSKAVDLVHLFTTDRQELQHGLQQLREQMGVQKSKPLRPDLMIWVSWPKKAAKIKTYVTEDVIREIALPLGMVDVKVCAVSEVWSGLKLVLRKELR
ncbi:DUF3052 domain-containing protein [Undibacterium cyanobacteriorum]|uniref:DUF3052 domain-containing protein n=1 Tax=Undibacterium cyanobacteriorum TaxID=3073561 RepID=A0ABY9RHL8_9BURK|nr:DUF3052 domain-containing protein [Undibacterium sp. 20NA77.5]WMW80721.1 DUF3052 domain-containing protein [Undibacterium sp. 20NA77.5]